jgi:hypothetical protein
MCDSRVSLDVLPPVTNVRLLIFSMAGFVFPCIFISPFGDPSEGGEISSWGDYVSLFFTSPLI